MYAPSMRLLAEKSALLESGRGDAIECYAKALEIASGEFYSQLMIAASIGFYINDKKWATMICQKMVAKCFQIEHELINYHEKIFNTVLSILKEDSPVFTSTESDFEDQITLAEQISAQYKTKLETVRRVNNDLLNYQIPNPSLFIEIQSFLENLTHGKQFRNKRGYFNSTKSLIHLMKWPEEEKQEIYNEI